MKKISNVVDPNFLIKKYIESPLDGKHYLDQYKLELKKIEFENKLRLLNRRAMKCLINDIANK